MGHREPDPQAGEHSAPDRDATPPDEESRLEAQRFDERVRVVLEQVRPMLRADGGDIELVATDVRMGRVEVRLKGACSRCSASIYTLSLGVEARLREAIPGIREVVSVC